MRRRIIGYCGDGGTTCPDCATDLVQRGKWTEDANADRDAGTIRDDNGLFPLRDMDGESVEVILSSLPEDFVRVSITCEECGEVES